MKLARVHILLVWSLLCCPLLASAQDDLRTVDGIITALYEVVSAGPGESRDWDRFALLFREGAQLTVGRTNAEGDTRTLYLSPQRFRELSEMQGNEEGFVEQEISRRTEQWGNMAHVFSTYESRHQASDPVPFDRGINSIQLIYDQGRWWVVNIYWMSESQDQALIKKYLRHKIR